MPSGLSLHESAHVIIALAGGGKVSEVSVKPGVGGSCTFDPRSTPAPIAHLLAVHAGPVAAEHLGGDGDGREMSRGDLESAASALARWEEETGQVAPRHLPSRLESEARALVAVHADEIIGLAKVLDRRGRLGVADLTEMAHTPGSPLSRYAALYPRPTPQPKPPAGATPGLSPRAYWSEAHQCFLDPVPPVRGRQAVRCATGLLG